LGEDQLLYISNLYGYIRLQINNDFFVAEDN